MYEKIADYEQHERIRNLFIDLKSLRWLIQTWKKIIKMP